MKHSTKLACLALSLFFIAPAHDAQAQKKWQSKREYLNEHGPSAPVRPALYPNISKDFLTALETFGVRPGMTLREAQAETAKWGARITQGDQSNLSDSAKPSPSNPYNQGHINGAFVYRTEPEQDYRGHPHIFHPQRPEAADPAGITLFTFPVDPLGDLKNPDNLIVYSVSTSARFVPAAGSKGVMPEAQFLSEGEKRLGHKLSMNTSSNRADCGYAVQDFTNRVIGIAEVLEPRPLPHLAAWKQCGTISLVQSVARNGFISDYRITHSDAALAERALNAFRVYGSEPRNAILQDRK